MTNQDGALAGLRGLVVLDGNWAQAKALWWRNAWLTKLRRFVIVPDGPSLYGNLRKEARSDAVSTREAVGLALSALEGGDVRERSPRGAPPIRWMVAMSRAWPDPEAISPRGAKTWKAPARIAAWCFNARPCFRG